MIVKFVLVGKPGQQSLGICGDLKIIWGAAFFNAGADEKARIFQPYGKLVHITELGNISDYRKTDTNIKHILQSNLYITALF